MGCEPKHAEQYKRLVVTTRAIVRPSIFSIVHSMGIPMGQFCVPFLMFVCSVGAATAEPTRAKFEKWTLVCSGPEKLNPESCAIVQPIESSGPQKYWADIIVAYNLSYNRVMRAVLPLGVDIGEGVAVGADKRQVGLLAFRACNNEGCLAEGTLDDLAWDQLYLSREATIVFKTGNEDGIGLTFSLSGLEKAVGEMAIRISKKADPMPLVQSPKGELLAPKDAFYVVQYGDTLYSVSRKYGLSVDDVALVNSIPDPGVLPTGIGLIIPGGGLASYGVGWSPDSKETELFAQLATAAASTGSGSQLRTEAKATKLRWPVQGRMIARFGKGKDGFHNDGINLAAPEGADIAAAESGQVAHIGKDLSGYGNLIIIDHGGGLVTAYAHCNKILVKLGDNVKRGQVIATVGRTGQVSLPQLHFQLRLQSQALDPLPLMAARDGITNAPR